MESSTDLREFYIEELMNRYKKLDYFLASLIVDNYLGKSIEDDSNTDEQPNRETADTAIDA